MYTFIHAHISKRTKISIHGIHLPPSLLSEIRTLSESSQQSFWWNHKPLIRIRKLPAFLVCPRGCLLLAVAKVFRPRREGRSERTTCSHGPKIGILGRNTLDSSTLGFHHFLVLRSFTLYSRKGVSKTSSSKSFTTILIKNGSVSTNSRVN